MENVSTKPFNILLAEDNPDDILIIKRAFKESEFQYNLFVTKDGEETMAFLNQEGEFYDAPLPDFILLDLNLPKKSGREILPEIKENPNMNHIPIVVLTISDSEKDIINSYDSHANCYITKSDKYKEFCENVKIIKDFWFSIVKLPRRKWNG